MSEARELAQAKFTTETRDDGEACQIFLDGEFFDEYERESDALSSIEFWVKKLSEFAEAYALSRESEHRWNQVLARDAHAEKYPTLVVCAVIIRDGKVLLEKRAPNGTKGLDDMWDLPGGKVEIGETPAQGIIREIKEELGITVQAEAISLRDLEASSWTYADGKTRHWILLPYFCVIKNGEPLCGERLKWFDVATLDPAEILAADLRIIKGAQVANPRESSELSTLRAQLTAAEAKNAALEARCAAQEKR